MTILFATASTAQTIQIEAKSACMAGPMAEFGQYIGDWVIKASQLSQEGTEWTDGAGARWNFVCVGEGTAVQDVSIPNDGPVGSNLRTHSRAAESRDIAWTIKGMPGTGFTHITA